MLITDPDLREHLRDLPTGYLIGLLMDPDNPQQTVIRSILWERGLAAAEVDALVRITSYNVCYTKLLRWPYCNVWKRFFFNSYCF